MKMDVRFVDSKHKSMIKDMWRYCFRDKDPFLSWYFEEKYRDYNTLAVYEDEIPVSSLQMLPYQLNFHGRLLDISYVVGAATLPEVRGKGYMKILLKRAVEIMRERGNVLNILLPFQYNFYRKYGWETCYYQKFYKIQMSDLKPIAKRYGRLRPVNINSDIDAMMSIYEKFIADKNGSIVRSKKDWTCIFTDHSFEGGMAYILEGENGNPEGYILYHLNAGVFNVHEMGFINSDAYRGLLWFVYAHAAQAEKVTWKAPIDDMTFISLSEPRRDIILNPFVMVRVLDVEKLLCLLYDMTPKAPDLVFYIEDPLIDWNTGTFSIFNGQVNKKQIIHKNDEMVLSCSINVLAQLAMGFISPMQAYQMGVLHTSNIQNIERAEKLFKKQNNFINDYY
jgi:predicted acetyltransferase